MTTLTFPRDNFDQDATFKFAYTGMRGTERQGRGYLFQNKDTKQIYVMQKSACIKDCYTAKDAAETARLNAMAPIRTDDVVEVAGVRYKVRILGDYSDAGRLDSLA